jgi:aspartate racemase
MKTIGMLGGMSWESSIEYYRIINQVTRQRLGGLHSANLVMVSVDFAPIELLQSQDRWEEAAEVLAASARQVQAAGADFLLIATNTMHKVYPQIQAALEIPVVHIADATAHKIREAGLERIGLLGTIYTMQQDFYKGRLQEQYGLDIIVPGESDQRQVDQVIFEELVLGIIREESREMFSQVIQGLIGMGAQGIILGCTEIPLIVNPEDFDVPIFDTTYIHAETAVDIALNAKELDISKIVD